MLSCHLSKTDKGFPLSKEESGAKHHELAKRTNRKGSTFSNMLNYYNRAINAHKHLWTNDYIARETTLLTFS